MKKLLTSLLTLLMVFTLVGCSSKEDTPVVEEPVIQEEVVEPVKEEVPEVVGGYTDVEDGTLTDELKDIFDSALEGLLGASYEPVELVATQVVAGTNYKFLANGTKTTNPITKGTYYITIYKDLQGNIELKDIEVIEEKQEQVKEEVKTQDITQMSFWVVFYDQYGNELQREALKYGTVPVYKSWLPEGFDKWVYKKSQKDVDSFKAITGNTYYQAVCHEVHHSSDGGSDPSPTPGPTPGPTPPTVPEGFVDLGITSGDNPLYWAKCNLGATSPENPGNYYMWGATALMYSNIDYSKTTDAFTFVTSNPYGSNYMNTWDTSANFDWYYIPFAEGTYSSSNKTVFTKYTASADYAKSGIPDNILTLESGDDAATATNSSWRTPTKDDFINLVKNCVLKWTDNYNGTNKHGYIVYKAKNESDKGKADMNGTWKKWNESSSSYANDSPINPDTYSLSDDHIFLPVTGFGSTINLLSFSSNGAYWASTIGLTNNQKADSLNFNNSSIGFGSNDRRNAYTIRPVTE